MANTFTQQLQLIKPTPADPLSQNTWGGLLNTDQDLVDSAVAGILTLSVAGSSNVVLSSLQGAADQERNQHFIFTGALTGNIDVLFPSSRTKTFSVANNTTGAFTLSIGVNNGSSAPLGTVVAVTQSASIELVSDGTNVVARQTAASSPSGAAGGDLSGTYPNPTVAKLQGRAVVSTAPTNGQVLTWVTANADWEPTSVNTGTVTGPGSSVSGNLPSFSGVTGVVIADSGIASANVALLAAAQSFTKAQRGAVVALTDGISTALDLSLSNNFSWIVTANSHVLANPTNAVPGQSGVISVTASGGSFSPSFDTQYVASGGVASLSFSATNGLTDFMPYLVIDSTHVLLFTTTQAPSH